MKAKSESLICRKRSLNVTYVALENVMQMKCEHLIHMKRKSELLIFRKRASERLICCARNCDGNEV